MLSLITALITPTHAFCGTYVGGAGAELYNNVSQVALVRQDGMTTLSISNDIEGDTSDFALVIPVPDVIPREAVHVLEHDLFSRLDQYSEPRLVSYVCEDFEYDSTTVSSTASSGGGGGGGTVDVEAHYVVGEYEIVVLSAEQSEGLLNWLSDNGYALPDATAGILDEYIDGGSYFFAAKVTEEAGIVSGDLLSPLQFSYPADVFSLPVRIGTTTSPGVQDLIIYAVNTYSDGKVAISNYTEIEIEDECLYDEATHGEFGAFYTDQFTRAYDGAGEAIWATEYAWGGSGCDPCTGTPPDEEDLVTLGYDPPHHYRTVYDVYFTRLHMRYTPEQAHSDLTLYQSGIGDTEQIRYIEYAWELEDRWPMCGSGWVDDPGSCDTDTDGTNGTTGGTSGDTSDDLEDGEVRSCGGCASGAPIGAAPWLALPLGLLIRRNRRR